MQVPSNLFLNKIGKPAIYLPTCMIVWGIISVSKVGLVPFEDPQDSPKLRQVISSVFR